MDADLTQQAHRDYLESQILSARPAETVYLLYKVAVDNVRLAIAKLKEGDIFARGKAINKAHEAVDELNFALDHSMGASFTRTLSDLYLYVQRQLMKGHAQKSEQALHEALGVLTTLMDTWKEVVAQTCGNSSFVNLQNGPVASHAETSEPADRSEPAEAARSITAYAGFPQGQSSRDWVG